jgi:hypothetical protein
MKQLIALILLLATLLSLVSCQNSDLITSETTAGTAEETNTGNQAATTEEKYNYPKVKNPMTWEKINSIPIASADMSMDQLRQICIDFFRLQLSFQWTPSKELKFGSRTLKVGQIYAGCPYISLTKSGNLYIAMRYYDSETGLMDAGNMTGTSFTSIIGNHCSSGSYWGWARVINTVSATLTAQINEANGFLRVGPYTYDSSIQEWSNTCLTSSVCEKNGTDVMYQSYAQLQKADGVVNFKSGGGHVRMVTEVHVEYNQGKIDGNKSYIIYIDQAANYTKQSFEDGSTATIFGSLDQKISFQKLYTSGYLPFTYAEFLGTDPVEKATVSSTIPQGIPTLKEIADASITSNYAISDLELTLTNTKGEVVYTTQTQASINNVKKHNLTSPVSSMNVSYWLSKEPDCTLKLTCRVSTGEVFTVYDGKIKQD